MPVAFIGHGSPMNAIQDNSFTRALRALGQTLPRPRALLCVSAHWMTRGTWVTAMAKPKTIHDFGGFPQALFDVDYSAPGSAEIAQQIRTLITIPKIGADDSEWGLDHGAWSILRHMYPLADIPTLQLSLDMTQGPEYHYQLGQRLQVLREEGILIVGSGNVVHNLRQIRWETEAPAFPWAIEFDRWMADRLSARDFQALTRDFLSSQAGKLSVPTMEHYYPLLYVVGAAREQDEYSTVFEGIQNASISMRSFLFDGA